MPLTAWMALSTECSDDKFADAVGAADFTAAVAVLWAAMQLVGDWFRLRMVAAVALGLLAALTIEGVVYRFVDKPSIIKYFEEHKAEIFKDQNLAPESFMAQQIESNLKSGSMLGFYHSANTYAAAAAFLSVIAMGWIAQRFSESSEKSPGVDWGVAVVALVLACGVWLLYHTASKAADATTAAALVMLLCIYPLRRWLSVHSARAFWLGCAAVWAALFAVVGHGWYHGGLPGSSLNFRWWYWTGALHMFPGHWLAGIGWNNFGFYYPQYRLPVASEDVKDPHDFLVKFFVELGVVGGLLAVAWLGLFWRHATRPLTPAPRDRSPENPRVWLIAVAAIALVLGLACGIDWTREPGAMSSANCSKRVLSLFAFLFAAGARCLDVAQIPAGRSASCSLAALRDACRHRHVPAVHGLVDFAMFESGPAFAS